MTKNIQWIDYDLIFSFPKIIGRTFLRHGGVSQGAFCTLNVGDGVGDHPDAVKVNRDIIRKTIGAEQLVFAKQIHGVDIVEITKENILQTHHADGLLTKEKNIALSIAHADCQAAIFIDKQQNIVAVIHAGWKGLVQNIYRKAIEYFTQRLSSNIDNIIVCISSSLGPSHAEFIDYKNQLPKEIWSYQVKPNFFDLRAIAKDQLQQCGLKDKQIEIDLTCTYEHPQDYYSYRRDHITGRHATVVVIKE